MDLEEALEAFPQRLATGLRYAYSEGGEMAFHMLERGAMPAPRALMAGLALDPVGRNLLEAAIDDEVQPGQFNLPEEADEVIIGGGAHAAIYAAARVREGHPRPLVLEKDARFGGTFAMTRRSAFFLNSRNRPGPLGAPGSRDALNVIAGAPMQPSDLGGSAYQANADLGLVVRCGLMMNATVRTATVNEIAQNGNRWLVFTNRAVVRAKRVIIATGLGPRKSFVSFPYDGERVMSFEQFMERMATMVFPLDGLGRVAVVGGGDSGRTAIEALTGYGPTSGGSVASLDHIESIDWYGVGADMTRERWLQCNRTRYKPLAVLFESTDKIVRNARVLGFPKVDSALRTASTVQLDSRTYDTVIGCFSFFSGVAAKVPLEEGARQSLKLISSRPDNDGGIALGQADEERTLVVVGPAANLGVGNGDDASLPKENKVALFRLAPRTEALARLLPPA